MNLIQIALEKGFKSDIPDFNHRDNWFGVSSYCPDVTLKSGNLEIQLSLSGIQAGMDNECCSDQFLQKQKNGVYRLTAKRIALYKDDQLIYKSCGGIMPDNKIIINFFKS